jgi:dolichol-phosphate mannosyltransferase
VVVPTYDEAENIEPLITRLDRALMGMSWEVIFADDNSPDGTHVLAKKLAETDRRVRCLRRVGRRGLAGACIDGILASSAPYVAVMDGDLQHDEAVLLRMTRRLQDGEGDLAIGTRYCDGGSASALNAHRGLLSRLATVLAQHLLGVRISDPMSGFFVVRREAFERFAPRLTQDGFKILLDLVTTAKTHLTIIEEPYAFRERILGGSKFQLRTGLEFLGLMAAKISNGVIAPRFVPYAFVGLIGLAVHLAALTSLHTRFGFEISQAVATFVAMTTNFLVNNTLTYRDMRLRGLAMIKGLFLFCLIGATGVVANVGIATLLYGQQHNWWLSGVAGAVIGSVWNYSMSNRLVWHAREPLAECYQ